MIELEKEYFFRLIDEKEKREIEEKRKSQTSEDIANEIGRLLNGARVEMVADEEGIHCTLKGNPAQLLVHREGCRQDRRINRKKPVGDLRVYGGSQEG